MKLHQVERSKFVESRFQNFQKKLKSFEKLGVPVEPEGVHLNIGGFGIMTNLEEHCEEINAPYKELVVCDGCNKNIEENWFIMFEGAMVYHNDCALERGWKWDDVQATSEKEIEKIIGEENENVVPLFGGKK